MLERYGFYILSNHIIWVFTECSRSPRGFSWLPKLASSFPFMNGNFTVTTFVHLYVMHKTEQLLMLMSHKWIGTSTSRTTCLESAGSYSKIPMTQYPMPGKNCKSKSTVIKHVISWTVLEFLFSPHSHFASWHYVLFIHQLIH